MELDKQNAHFQIALDQAFLYLDRVIAEIFILWIGFKVMGKLVPLISDTLKRMGVSGDAKVLFIGYVRNYPKGSRIFYNCIHSRDGYGKTGRNFGSSSFCPWNSFEK